MRPLEVDPFASRVGGQQHLYRWVVAEGFLRLVAILAGHAPVNDDYRLRTSKQRGDAVLQVAECVAVLREEYQLLRRGGHWTRDFATAVGSCWLSDIACYPRRCKNLTEQAGKLPPLRVFPTVSDIKRAIFQHLQGFDLHLQFGDGAGGGRLVEDMRFGGFDLVPWCVVEILNVFGIKLCDCGRGQAGTSGLFQLAQAALQTLAPSAQ